MKSRRKIQSNVFKFPTQKQNSKADPDFDLVDINELITGGKEGFNIFSLETKTPFANIGDLTIYNPNYEPKTDDLIFCQIEGRTTIVQYEVYTKLNESVKFLGVITHFILKAQNLSIHRQAFSDQNRKGAANPTALFIFNLILLFYMSKIQLALFLYFGRKIQRLMNGQELKERRNALKIKQWHFANLLRITAGRLYRWESGRAAIPPNVEQVVENIEEKFNERKNRANKIVD